MNLFLLFNKEGITLQKETIKRAITYFIDECADAGCKSSTIIAYEFDLHIFRTYIKYNLPSVRYVQQANSKVISAYHKWLKEQKYKSTSIRRKLIVLNLFFNYMVNYKDLDENPILYVIKDRELIKCSEENVVLTISEFQTLIDSIKPGKTSARDIAVLSVMFYTGARRSDAIDLNWYDIDFNNNTIKISRPKNLSYEVLPMAPRLKNALKNLHDESNPRISDAIFLGVRGKRLSTSTLSTLIADAVTRSQIEKEQKITSHSFRRSFCSNSSSGGADLTDITNYTGHKDLETLKSYTVVDNNRIRQLLDTIA